MRVYVCLFVCKFRLIMFRNLVNSSDKSSAVFLFFNKHIEKVKALANKLCGPLDSKLVKLDKITFSKLF